MTLQHLTDLSTRAISLARMIDRLCSGEYIIMLVKPDVQGAAWDVKIIRAELLRSAELPRREA